MSSESEAKDDYSNCCLSCAFGDYATTTNCKTVNGEGSLPVERPAKNVHMTRTWEQGPLARSRFLSHAQKSGQLLHFK